MKFACSNKFNSCYYVASKWACKHLWGNIYFAGDGTVFDIISVVSILLKDILQLIIHLNIQLCHNVGM